jgi:hypothetical protein
MLNINAMESDAAKVMQAKLDDDMKEMVKMESMTFRVRWSLRLRFVLLR